MVTTQYHSKGVYVEGISMYHSFHALLAARLCSILHTHVVPIWISKVTVAWISQRSQSPALSPRPRNSRRRCHYECANVAWLITGHTHRVNMNIYSKSPWPPNWRRSRHHERMCHKCEGVGTRTDVDHGGLQLYHQLTTWHRADIHTASCFLL